MSQFLGIIWLFGGRFGKGPKTSTESWKKGSKAHWKIMTQRIVASDLLGWATSNMDTTPSNSTQTALPPPPDSKWLDIIMGKADAVIMKECLETLDVPTATLDEKLANLDRLQMLLESLDNSNDIKVLNGYKTLLNLVRDEDDDVRMNSFWCLGIIVQNNEKTQLDFIKCGGLEAALIGVRDPSQAVVKKALYCISGIQFIYIRKY
jgi:hypothetical protein